MIAAVFVEESLWIRDALAALDKPAGSAVLDVGSSTREYREVRQPYVEANVFAPLRAAGLDVVHLDAKAADGVDVVCDVTDPDVDVRDQLGRGFDVVICTNFLEHVVDRERVAATVASLVADGGHLLVTVPQVYRRHLDPIDTMYRPSPRRLIALLRRAQPALAAVRADSVEVRDRRAYRRHPSRLPLWGLREEVRYRVKPLRWRQACVLLQRGAPLR